MKSIGKILGPVFAILLAAGAICLLYALFCGTGVPYYAQIDNARVKPTESGGGVVNFEGSLPYTYTLPAYDGNGREREISFGASRELKDGAFIRLEVVPVRGVVRWAEVRYDELPTEVQSRFPGTAG